MSALTAKVTMGVAPMSMRETFGASASRGRFPTPATLSRTSCTARSSGTVSLNCTKMSPTFSRAKLWMTSTPWMPATASSMGLLTCASISAGPAPR